MTSGRGASLGKAALLLLVAAVCAPAMAGNAASEKNWTGTAVKFDDWQAGVRAGDNAAVVTYGSETIRIVPIGADGARANNTLGCTVAESEDGTRTIQASFTCAGSRADGTFVLSPDGKVEVRPGEGFAGISIEGPIRYGVLPGIFLEDVIYDPADCDISEVCVPSENIILGFLEGGNGILTCVWPEGEQKVTLAMPGAGALRPIVESINVALDGKSAFLTVLSAPGIWQRVELLPEYLEKDVELSWKRPFDARWKTELLENDVKTTFVFVNGQESEWRPMIGFFVWPVWFDGGKSMVHLAKKIPPEGSAFIWPLSGNSNTPLGFAGRTPCAGIFSGMQRRERYPEGPRKAPNVGYIHCWGTAVIKRTVFQYGFQDREREFLRSYVDYCVDYVASIQTRNKEFRAFIDRMSDLLEEWAANEKGNPAVAEFIEGMRACLKVADEGWHARIESGGRRTPDEHVAYCDKLGERMMELIETGGTESYAEEMAILSAFNGLSAACDEDMPAGFGSAVRDWFVSAARECMDKPEALPYAESIRDAIREKLKCRKWETTGI